MVVDDNAISLLSTETITKKASDRWNSKTTIERVRCGSKYKHIFVKHNLDRNDWGSPFSELTKHQQNILIKGELIRTYDAMSNGDKSIIKRHFKLPKFSSKWFKLDQKGKRILLTSILKNA